MSARTRGLAEEQGLEPRVTVLETVGLPLTDSSKEPAFCFCWKR